MASIYNKADMRDNNGMKISFCTTCKGRLGHLKETLPQNLRNAADYPNTEFVILDYDSKDGLEDWIKQNYKAELDSGKIRYAKFEPAPYFNMAHAKNMAHRIATGDVLCNLDADNIIAPGFASWLNEQFSKDKNICLRPHCGDRLIKRLISHSVGMGGRIAIHRDNFLAIHGYDEHYSGWGNDDNNFEQRAQQAGLKIVSIPYMKVGHAIAHDDTLRTTLLAPDDKVSSEKFIAHNDSWQGRLNQVRRLTGLDSHSHGIAPSANSDGHFGCGTVRLHNNNEINLRPLDAPLAVIGPVSRPSTAIR